VLKTVRNRNVIRRLFQGLILTSLSVLVSIILAETLLHLFPGLLPVELQLTVRDRGIAHATIGSLPEPSSTGLLWTRDFKITHEIDAHGFRNPGPWPTTADVVTIGDSLTFGYGVEAHEAWPRILELETGRSVVNLGLIGAGPQQHLRLYETFGRALKPQLVVIGAFVANDFWDTEMFDRWEHSGAPGNYLIWRDFGRPTAERLERFAGRYRYFMRQNSRLYQLVRYGQSVLRSRRAEPPVVVEPRPGVALQLRPAYLEATTTYAHKGSRYFETAIESLRELRDQAAARGASTLVLLQPSKEETYMALLGQPIPDPAKDFREALEELAIAYVDLGPLFRDRAQRGEVLFFATDGHPNADGYRLAAEGLLGYLKERRVLSLPSRL